MIPPKIVYWNNIPTPYVVGRFNALASRGNIGFEAWFNEIRESDRSWDVTPAEWQFDARYIPAIHYLGRTLQLPGEELNLVRPQLLVSLFGTPSFVIGASLGRHLAERSSFRVLPTYDSWIERSRVKEVTKQVLFRAVDSVKVPGDHGGEFAARYGIPDDRICRVTQSIDVEHFASARNVSSEMRKAEREKRGLNGCVFIYTGRLWAGKGLDTLIDAFQMATQQFADASLLLVGDGVDEDRYREKARGLSNVHFEGFVQPVNLPSIYALADAFVFPTLGDPHGLVVEEAMAAGLPVISSESAGDIRSRLPEGQAGFVVAPSDSLTLSERMLALAKDSRLRRDMGEAAYQLVLERDHDHYANDFEQFVERTLSLPPNKGRAALTVQGIGAGLARVLPKRLVAQLV